MTRLATILWLVLACTAGATELGEIAEIRNFRQYSPDFASSGQPTAAQLEAVRDAGFERVVYIAFSDHDNSLAGEDRRVRELGMQYLHIPVDWEAPTPADFYLFAGAMQRAPAARTLLHCQVNYRASAFAFLYRVLYADVAVAEAKRDLDSVWSPNDTWRALIFAVLEENGVSPQCDDCDW